MINFNSKCFTKLNIIRERDFFISDFKANGFCNLKFYILEQEIFSNTIYYVYISKKGYYWRYYYP